MSEGTVTTFCASCRVDYGVCPDCGTYWIARPDGKRLGVRPVDHPTLQAVQPDGSTVLLPWLERWPNVVTR